MTINIIDFVYGNIMISDVPDKSDMKKLSDDNGNSMYISAGESIIFASNSQNQKWIDSGVITDFNAYGDPERIEIDNITLMHVKGCAYIGKLPQQ